MTRLWESLQPVGKSKPRRKRRRTTPLASFLADACSFDRLHHGTWFRPVHSKNLASRWHRSSVSGEPVLPQRVLYSHSHSMPEVPAHELLPLPQEGGERFPRGAGGALREYLLQAYTQQWTSAKAVHGSLPLPNRPEPQSSPPSKAEDHGPDQLMCGSACGAIAHDDAHDAFMTLPPYTRSRESEARQLRSGPKPCRVGFV